MGLCPNSLYPLKGLTPRGLAARVPMPIAGKVTVPGEVAATPGSCPGVPQPSPPARPLALVGQLLPCATRDQSVPPMWVQTSPTDLARPGPGLPSQKLEQPQGRTGGGHQVPPYHGTSLCAPRSYFPPRFSLPWVTQLQLIPIARPGLYLGHGAAQRRRRRAGSRGGGWGVPEAALQEGDGGQGMGTGHKIGTVLPRTRPHTKCLAAGEPEQPDLHKCRDPALPAPRHCRPRRGTPAWHCGSEDSQALSGDTVKGLAWPAAPSLQ